MAARFWNESNEAELSRLEALGWSAAEIAHQIGTSRNAVISKSNRLRGVKFEYRTRVTQKQIAKKEYRKAREHELLVAMKNDIAIGVPRNRAIFRALLERVPAKSIAKELGLSTVRIYQIAKRQSQYWPTTRLPAKIAAPAPSGS